MALGYGGVPISIKGEHSLHTFEDGEVSLIFKNVVTCKLYLTRLGPL